MIIYHEGLPRSGKSYEAVVRRIIPALQNGRAVDAYIEGLDHEKIAPLAGISVEVCRELLRVLGVDEAPRVAELARDNALIVLDEVQDYWGNRVKLDEATTRFATQHGHRGIDIVLLGQDLRDVHALFRRRVELKLCFLKLSGVGQENRYSVTTYRHKGGDKFDQVGVSFCKYESKYFGTYKSHTSEDIQTGNYKDPRAELFGNPWVIRGAIAVLAGVIWGGWQVKQFFWPNAEELKKRPAAVAPFAASAPLGAVPLTAAVPVPRPAPVPAAAPAPDKRSPQERRFDELTTSYKIRLAGLVTGKNRVLGVVEWVDGNSRVVERMTLDALRDLGVAVLVGDGYVRLAVGQWEAMATMWPLEDVSAGRVSVARLDSMRPDVPAVSSAAPVIIGPGGNSSRIEPAAPLAVTRGAR